MLPIEEIVKFIKLILFSLHPPKNYDLSLQTILVNKIAMLLYNTTRTIPQGAKRL